MVGVSPIGRTPPVASDIPTSAADATPPGTAPKPGRSDLALDVTQVALA